MKVLTIRRAAPPAHCSAHRDSGHLHGLVNTHSGTRSTNAAYGTAGPQELYRPCLRVRRLEREARCSAGTIGSAADASQEDTAYMLQALDLAKRALGQTYPNPAVGCVIVKDGQVVGEGYHPKAGEPHAEVFALRAAGQQAAGAAAYVTLEPCNHHGRTPPCSQALVDAGVERVVVGAEDPNPLVGGSGIATLQKARIEVLVGVAERECYDINTEFMERMKAQTTK